MPNLHEIPVCGEVTDYSEIDNTKYSFVIEIPEGMPINRAFQLLRAQSVYGERSRGMGMGWPLAVFDASNPDEKARTVEIQAYPCCEAKLRKAIPEYLRQQLATE